MSTIKSSTEHLTLNADGSGKDIKFQANGVEKASISSAGAFTSTSIDATKLSGALPAIDGSALTGVGKVLQVVSSEAPSVFSTTNSTVQSTGHSATITPSATTSKIYVMVTWVGQQLAVGRTYKAYLYRGATKINGVHLQEDGNSIPKTSGVINDLDSPATTSAVTYEMFVGTDGVGTSYYNTSNAIGKATITLMEIGA